ncbi:MAG: metalloregulator ArsR/SmtB family transcription factor [Thermoleophilia bacterium]|nr:metalloregulator ArsR/SmtB family transcription factor [Thermoleophilia bacterium]
MTQHPTDVTDDSALDTTVRTLKALAHPIRLRIVQMLADKRSFGINDESCCAQSEVCVCKITGLFDVSMPTISHHLKLLREAGLVETRRDGVWIYYSLRREALEEVVDVLRGVTVTNEPATASCGC